MGLLLIPSSIEQATQNSKIMTEKLSFFTVDLSSPNTVKQELHNNDREIKFLQRRPSHPQHSEARTTHVVIEIEELKFKT